MTIPAHEPELDQVMTSIEQNWIEIAAFAAQSHRAFGRGIVRLSNTAKPESYILEEKVTDKQRKADVMAYDPLTTVLILCPISQGNIFVKFMLQPGPAIASSIHKLHRMNKGSRYYGTHTTRLIRMADVKYYERIFQLALEIINKLYTTITEPHRCDVLRLSIRLIGQSQTMCHLGTPSVSLVPRLGGQEAVVDISSISSIFRTIVETYLTMHEVFFEPKDDNDFEFFHSRWMLVGLHNVKKHVLKEIYNVYVSGEVEPLRIDATRRMKNTTQYQDMLSKKKNNHDKAMDALLQRTRNADEWQRLARSANISIPAFQHTYSSSSGYIHADGFTSYKLHQRDAADFDLEVEVLLHIVSRIVSKMICDFAERYEEAEQIASANEALYKDIKESKIVLSEGKI